MKGYLKSGDSFAIPLAPKVTTVGREGCDLILQQPGIDQQHAVIEYNTQEDCFVLQDLNTAQGTYVNDVRVQNAAVRLAPGDVIRFGFSGSQYQLDVENPPQVPEGTQPQWNIIGVNYPPVQFRPAWTQPLGMLPDQQPTYAQTSTTGAGLPYLSSGVAPSMSCTLWSPIGVQQAPPPSIPRPPLRSRPVSAGGATYRRSSFDRPPTHPIPIINSSSYGNTIPATTTTMSSSPQVMRSMNGGWTGAVNARPSAASSPIATRAQNNMDNSLIVLQEKEQKINQLNDELNQLRVLETEILKKDQVIQYLQGQLMGLQAQLDNAPSYLLGGDADITQKLLLLESEVNCKKSEVDFLKEELSRMKQQTEETGPMLRQELGERVTELTSVRKELDRVKKDKNITSGLVTQMQRDMANKTQAIMKKDMSISKLTREIENMRKDAREKDSQLNNMANRVTKVTDQKKVQEERDAREKELISLRHKFKTAENKVQLHEETIEAMKAEMDKMRLSVFEAADKLKKAQNEAESAKSQFVDMERAERIVRVDLEQVSKKMERFRNRVIQVTFSSPGEISPQEEITDDKLVETLKKFIDDRAALRRKIEDLESELKEAMSSNEDSTDSVQQLQKHLEEAMGRIKEKGSLSNQLRQEVDLLQSVIVEETGSWVKSTFLDYLSNQLTWEQSIENALEKCGVNVKISTDSPDKHISLLFAKWESSITEKERLSAQITSLEEAHKADLERQINAISTEIDGKVTEAVEKAKLADEERFNRALDEIRIVEMEKRENALKSEQAKVDEIRQAMAQLQLSFTERQQDDTAKLEAASETVRQLEEYKQLEVTLMQQIEALQLSKAEEVEKVRQENSTLGGQVESEILQYKEQIKQHSVTICAMEDRLTKVSKRNKDFQEENLDLKKTIQNLKNQSMQKPPSAPKPRVIVQAKNSPEFVAMEQMIAALRPENFELKKRLKEQQDVILGLRRDLTGASARLSDVTGELSEKQKQEIEQNRAQVYQQKGEIIELRQQMAKLSQIIDKQKEEVKILESDLNKEKSISRKFQQHIDENLTRIRTVEDQLSDEKEEQKKQLDLLENEGRITSEMTALGAQCRGERHEQVIMRQREALSELRARVRSLEQSRPPLPTQDQALQQVIVLKKELAEMRANQALAENKTLHSVTSLDRELSRVRGINQSNTGAEVEMEKSAHRETMDALETSETTYLALLRKISACLELEDMIGGQSMAHIPRDERNRLKKERENVCDQLAKKISVLSERLVRKDEMLQDYERDLAKLRQAQEIAGKKGGQIETLVHDLRGRSEECDYLRESLNRTQTKLDQEKRLNTAIKQKKTFHLENERAHLNHTTPSHRCPPEDPMGKNIAKRRQQRELIKRKNYEIKTLKTDLCETEKNLTERESRLYKIETSLSLEQPVEVVE